jgi:hypothetical protein
MLEPGSFDLSELSGVLWIKWLRAKWAIGVGFIILVSAFAILFAFSAVNATVHGAFASHGAADFVLVALFLVFGGLMYWANIRWTYPAIGLVVGPEGLVIRYRSNSTLTKAWEDATFSLNIERLYFPPLKSTISSCVFPWSPRLFMRDDVVEEIVAAARARGLDVLSVRDPNSTSGDAILIRATST